MQEPKKKRKFNSIFPRGPARTKTISCRVTKDEYKKLKKESKFFKLSDYIRYKLIDPTMKPDIHDTKDNKVISTEKKSIFYKYE